mgnify:CR=1 FL=1
MSYELDTLGRLLTVKHLNKDGLYHCNKIGVSARRYEYDSAGNLCSEYTFDLLGNPVLNEFNWHKAINIYDNHGNIIEISYYNTIGELCLDNVMELLNGRTNTMIEVTESRPSVMALMASLADNGFQKKSLSSSPFIKRTKHAD